MIRKLIHSSTLIMVAFALAVLGPFSSLAHADVFYTISGTFTDRSGNPVTNAPMKLHSSSTGDVPFSTDASGNYSVNVIPDTYSVGFNGDYNYSEVPFPIYLGGGGAIDATGGNATQDLQLDTVALDVDFVDQNNNPISGAQVSVSTTGGSTTLLVGHPEVTTGASLHTGTAGNTDSSGSVSTTVLRGLTYDVCAIDPNIQVEFCKFDIVLSDDDNLVVISQGITSPENLVAQSNITNQAPVLSWDAVGGADHYDVYRDGSVVGSPTGTSFTDSTVTEGSHEYYVKAVTGGGLESDPSNSITVVYDSTAPSITHLLSPLANTHGWHNGDVTVSFDCADTLTLVVSCTDPVTVSNEGANQDVVGTAEDEAGNTATETVALNVDKTNPTITADVDQAPNSNGWHNGDVTVSFDCDDTLSGVQNCTAPVTLTAEGANQVVSGTATDYADNTAGATTTLNIDKTDPSISYTLSPEPVNGWNTSDVTVTFDCNDSLSGVEVCPAPVTVSTEGEDQEVSGTAVDYAGNSASLTAFVNIDKTAPDVTSSVSPLANAFGWSNTDITVSFTCTDSLSGVATCTNPITLSTEGFGQVASGTSTDNAGNSSSTSTTVNIDKTAPDISYSVSPAANANGWHNSDPTVSFNCNDSLSGMQSCSSPVTVTNEGASQAINGSAVDYADNSSSVTASVNLDKTAPTVSNPTMSNRFILFFGNVNLSANAGDSLSGVQRGEYFIDTDPGQGNGTSMTYSNGNLSASATISGLSFGTHTMYMRTLDMAGNWSPTTSITFIYFGFSFF